MALLENLKIQAVFVVDSGLQITIMGRHEEGCR